MKCGGYILAQQQFERDSHILGKNREPCVCVMKYGGRVLAQNQFECDSHILGEKHGSRVWTLRSAFYECGSRVASMKRGSQPRIHCLQNRLQLQSLQFVVDERDPFVNI